MSSHAPTNGPGNALYVLGQGYCPNCRPTGGRIRDATPLTHKADGSGVCPDCDSHYPITRGDGL